MTPNSIEALQHTFKENNLLWDIRYFENQSSSCSSSQVLTKLQRKINQQIIGCNNIKFLPLKILKKLDSLNLLEIVSKSFDFNFLFKNVKSILSSCDQIQQTPFIPKKKSVLEPTLKKSLTYVKMKIQKKYMTNSFFETLDIQLFDMPMEAFCSDGYLHLPLKWTLFLPLVNETMTQTDEIKCYDNTFSTFFSKKNHFSKNAILIFTYLNFKLTKKCFLNFKNSKNEIAMSPDDFIKKYILDTHFDQTVDIEDSVFFILKKKRKTILNNLKHWFIFVTKNIKKDVKNEINHLFHYFGNEIFVDVELTQQLEEWNSEVVKGNFKFRKLI